MVSKKGVTSALLYLILSALFILVMVFIIMAMRKDGVSIIESIPFF